MNKVQVGLVGFGMGGSVFHAPLITSIKGFCLKTIRETREPNIALANERYPDTKIVADSSEIFNDGSIDLVVLAVPNKHHYKLTKEALNAGKHVVVEKPFTVTTTEADDLLALAKEKGKILTVYQNRRWDSDFMTVRKIIKSGMLGRLVEFESHYDRFRNTIRPDTWKEEGTLGTGLLYDLGSHLIDQALVLFGTPAAITADIRSQRDESKIPDNFELILHYEKLKVTLKSGMLVKEPLPKYILFGTEGSFVKYGLDVQEEALKAGAKPADNEHWGAEPEDLWGTLNTTYNGISFRGKVESEKGNYLEFYKNLYAVLKGEQELQVKPEQARNTIRVMELAMSSSEEKKTIKFE